MAEAKPHEPFPDVGRQRESDRLGMLIFLASEAMLFGGIFAAALALRVEHPADYVSAAHKLRLGLGTLNTAILLTSSLAAALAVEAARAGRTGRAAMALGSAAGLGVAFLAVKAFEYWAEYREGLTPGTTTAHFSGPVEQLFMNLYFVGTGLHAIHVTIGILLMAAASLNRRARHDRQAVFISNVALYWHLVDIVWVFLFPTLYLAGVR